MNDVAPLHPEFGEPKVLEAPEADGGYVLNFAALVETARTIGTPAGGVLYRALVAAWRALDGLQLSAGDRQERALREGLAVLERSEHTGPLQ